LNIDNEINTLSVIELFGTKIKALIERAAPRDLYDVYNMLNQKIIHSNQQDLLRKTILFYLAVGAKKKIEQPFDFENISALKYRSIRANLAPVLKKTEHFDFETAKTEVKKYLNELTAFTGNEKQFLENFNQGNYTPKLLFDDDEIINRIEKHPMAIWRTTHSTTRA
jgi:predicted nucleotidyltransferase component of viral defense system